MCHRRNTAVAFEVFFEKQPFSQSQWHNLHLCLPKELFVNIALYTHCSSYFNLAIFLFSFLVFNSWTCPYETIWKRPGNCCLLISECSENLLPMADIVTPNVKEASALLGGMQVVTVADMCSAAKLLHNLGPRLVQNFFIIFLSNNKSCRHWSWIHLVTELSIYKISNCSLQME